VIDMQQESGGLTWLPVGMDPHIAHSVAEATGEFMEKAMSYDLLNAGVKEGRKRSKSGKQPKSYFVDPTDMLLGLGMQYLQPPSSISYYTMKMVAEKNSVVGAIHQTRLAQLPPFLRLPRNKFDVGLKVRPVRKLANDKSLTDDERRTCEQLEDFMLHTGHDYSMGRDSLLTWGKKIMRDRLTYDQMTFECVPDRGGGVHSFHAVDASTIRIYSPHGQRRNMLPIEDDDIHTETKFVQVINGRVKRRYPLSRLSFSVANPRTDLRVAGYGFSEIEMLTTTVMSHLWAEEWNRGVFKNGSTQKGVINFKGNIPREKFEVYKRDWRTYLSGVHNAHRTGVMNAQDGMEWFPLQLSNTEMGFSTWIEYLIKICCSFYQMDTTEINFDLRGTTNAQPMFMSSNDAQQKLSKDRGMAQNLAHIEAAVNRHIIWRTHPGYVFFFDGLNAKTMEQHVELLSKMGTTTHTINEVRDLDDLPPIKGGDIIMNAIYAQRLATVDQPQPGVGGPPGMPPQGGQEDDQEGAPYEEMGQEKPGLEEQQGAQALQQGAPKDASQVKPISKKVSKTLHRDDWENSSMFMSMTGTQGEVRKSLFGQDAQDELVVRYKD